MKLCPEHVLQLTYRKTKEALKRQEREKQAKRAKQAKPRRKCSSDPAERMPREQQQQQPSGTDEGANGGAQPCEEQHEQQTQPLSQQQQMIQGTNEGVGKGSEHRKKKRRRGDAAFLEQGEPGVAADAAAEPVEAEDDLLADTVAQWRQASAV